VQICVGSTRCGREVFELDCVISADTVCLCGNGLLLANGPRKLARLINDARTGSGAGVTERGEAARKERPGERD
jgi:hypothetical protein